LVDRSNEAFQIASHIVEHVSGLPISAYFKRNIFQPLGLNSTFLDVSGGLDGIYANTVPYPSYVAYLNPVELGMYAFDKGYIGSATYTAGTVNAAALSPKARAAAGAGAPGRWAKTGRSALTSVPGSDFGYSSGSGAIQGSVGDMARWLRALTVQPQRLGLKPETVRRMLNTSTRIPEPKGTTPFGSVGGAVAALKGRLRYAQGVVVVQDPSNRRLGVSGLFYKGSLGGFDATYYLALHPTDPSKDTFVYVMTTTNTAFPAYSPYIVANGNRCSFKLNNASSSLPAYMCDAKKPLMGQGPAALLLDTYLKGFTGKGALGL
jgi:CubicO group peptidase (beta-lactamase class C family)